MFVLANILIGLARVLEMILKIYRWILIARAVTSWVNADPRNPIVSFLYAVTEPVLMLIRRRLPMSLRYFPLDVAFFVLFGIVIFAEFAVVQTLIDVAMRLRER
jgi:YggT family protein